MNATHWSRFAALGFLLSAPLSQAALCARDQVPAATLLLPWFEVSTACAANEGRNTVFTVSNTSAQSRLARVTLWTNAAVPVLAVDVFMNGFAQETIDLRAVLCDGALPVTGIALAEVGRHADPETNFTGCNAGTTPGQSPVYAPLPGDQRAHLRAVLSGQPSPFGGQCAGLPTNETGLAVGYVTVDAVTACNLPFHDTAGLYAGLSNANVLAGTAALTDFNQNYSISLPMLAIEAADAAQLDNSSSFYGAPAAGQNPREPLPVAWQVDVDQSGTFEAADLVVWRAPAAVGTPFNCAAGPAWHPLPLSNTSGFGSRGWYLVDDAGKAYQPSVRNPFQSYAQRITPSQAGAEFANLESGSVFANLEHEPAAPSPLFEAQGWMGAILRSEGRYAHLSEGAPVGAACKDTPFNNAPLPPRTMLP